jgi:hypothetical protein
MTTEPVPDALERALQHCRDMDAPLAERLQTFATAVRRLRPDFQSAVVSGSRATDRSRTHDPGERDGDGPD